MTFKLANCKIGAMLSSVVFKTPFPIATTSKWIEAELRANSTGLIKLVNSIGCGSWINAMSLLTDKLNKLELEF